MEKETYNYKECKRNHAASLGTYATDGCGEYTPDPTTPSILSCAACGCHRNFHRKVHLLMLVKEGGEQRKRRRTKFSPEQKERMARFAESIEWKMPRKGGEVGRFCGEVGVDRQVFRVWMHNHKKEKERDKEKESSSSGTGDKACEEELKHKIN